jgi:hydrogenase 3 maturation protease
MRNKLSEFLLRSANNQILWVGMGNPIRNDDGVGIYISDRIKERANLKVLTVELGLENHIGKINNMKVDILVLIDCTGFGQQEGYFDLVPINEVRDHTLNTHHFSLNELAAIIKSRIYLLGIQPGNIGFGEKISKKVLESANEIIGMINKQVG